MTQNEAAGILMSVNRTATVFSITESFHNFLTSQLAREPKAQSTEVGVGCAEAPTHSNRYAQWLSLEDLTLHDAMGGRQERSIWLVAGDRLCPLSLPIEGAVILSPKCANDFVLQNADGLGK